MILFEGVRSLLQQGSALIYLILAGCRNKLVSCQNIINYLNMSSLKSFKLGNCLILSELGGHQANILHFSFNTPIPIQSGENLGIER